MAMGKLVTPCSPVTAGVGLLLIGIGDADQFGTGQSSENAGMIGAHDADADNADAQHALR